MAYTVVDKGSKYFDTKLYTGTGATQSITGLNFSPDFVWLKSRGEAQDHYLFDSIRTATKALSSNLTLAEQTYSDSLTSFNSDGFTLGASTRVNKNTFNHVGWCWDANGTGVSNTAGTITSTVSANTTSGFSIVSYAGNSTNDATIGHGLGVAPSMVIIKNRTSALSGTAGGHWVVKHKSIGMTASGSASQLYLSLTNASSNNDHGTLITNGSTLLQIKSGSSSPNYFHVGETGNNYIAYCFAEVKGFSKFGSYTGNGSTNGTFVYTGFSPAFILVKNTTTAGNSWAMFDNKRLGYNVSNLALFPSDSSAETSGTSYIDILSNGFKMRSLNDFNNKSGDTYIYMAFAENPFVSSKGIPTTAR